MQLFVRDLTVIDFSYLCPTRGMVGESWIVDVLLDGDLDELSMLLDFGQVKRAIKATLDDVIDHRLLVPTESPKFNLQIQDEQFYIDFESEKGSIHLVCPDQAFALIPSETIDFDSVNAFLLKTLTNILPNNIDGLSLTLRNELHQMPYYHYSHGLKKHNGNCQRIAHGHRSPIQIFENSISAPQWDEYWAKRWQDIYLGSQEDLISCELLSLSPLANIDDSSHYGFCYQSPQGKFQLAMPIDCCELIPHDTTIELLADFIAKQMYYQFPQSQFKVIAFEGVGKGAIAISPKERG